MAKKYRQLYCQRCGLVRTMQKPKVDHRRHAFLTLATAGLWGPAWLGIILRRDLEPWTCGVCHSHRREPEQNLQNPRPYRAGHRFFENIPSWQ